MRIAIATAFEYFDPQYSLTTVVKDRYHILTKQGHDVEVWVQENFYGEEFDLPLVKIMPRFRFNDYQNNTLLDEDHENVDLVYNAISKQINDNSIESVFIEDLLFQGWYYVHSVAISKFASENPNIKFFSVAHSVPAGMKTTWSTPPSNITLIALNENIRQSTAENYRTTIDQVKVIHNAMDFRTYLDRDPIAIELYEKFKLMEANVIQIYPYSAERWQDKGVDKLIKIFSSLKKLGNKVRLVLATAWYFPEHIIKVRDLCRQHGLFDDEVIITSELYPKQMGISNRAVKELMSVSNLFVFPTRAEASPLILAEAMMAGCLIVVNDLLPQLLEITSDKVLKFHLNSSIHHGHELEDESRFYGDVARIIDAELRTDLAIMTKDRIRKNFCFEYLYKNEYAPVLFESPKKRAVSYLKPVIN
jgi:glycosyltransferase involved in cell wall biosynthesis